MLTFSHVSNGLMCAVAAACRCSRTPFASHAQPMLPNNMDKMTTAAPTTTTAVQTTTTTTTTGATTGGTDHALFLCIYISLLKLHRWFQPK